MKEDDPVKEILAGYDNFVAIIAILAKALGVSEGPIKETLRHLAFKREVREGKIDRESKFIYMARSKATNQPKLIVAQDADGFVGQVVGVWKSLRYKTPRRQRPGET